MFKKIYLKNQYHELIQSFDERNLIQSIYSSRPEELGPLLQHSWVFHSRLSSIKNSEQDFRNSCPKNVLAMVTHAISHGIKVVNISEHKMPISGVVNLCNNFKSLTREEIILIAIASADVYVGDSSGPTVVAQVLNKPSILFNLFPYYVIPKNPDSLIHFRKIMTRDGEVPFNTPLFKEANRCTYAHELEKLGIWLEEAEEMQLKNLVDEYLTITRDGPSQAHLDAKLAYNLSYQYASPAGFISNINRIICEEK